MTHEELMVEGAALVRQLETDGHRPADGTNVLACALAIMWVTQTTPDAQLDNLFNVIRDLIGYVGQRIVILPDPPAGNN
jgi:hypothetical protein